MEQLYIIGHIKNLKMVNVENPNNHQEIIIKMIHMKSGLELVKLQDVIRK